jgi:hypothetical protein
MFVPFTDRVRDALRIAEQEARRLEHEYVGTEHILLGLFKAQPKSVSPDSHTRGTRPSPPITLAGDGTPAQNR